MPKLFSRRIDGILAAYKPKNFLGAKGLNWMDPLHTMHSGKSKNGAPKKADVAQMQSGYDGVDSSTFSGPFGSGSSSFGAPDPTTGKRSIDTSMSLDPALQQAGHTAETGLNANLGYLQRDPTQQVQNLTSGGDPLYNVINEQTQRAYDQNLGRLKLNAQQSGAGNSTAAGSAYGRLMGDKSLNDNQNLYTALNYGNQTATQNANTNLGAIGNLAQTVYPLGSAANAQLNTATQAQDAAKGINAKAQNAANNEFTAEQNAYNYAQQKGQASGTGQLIGTLGGAALGSMAGPGGTMMGAQLGGQIGGSLAGGGSQPVQYSSPYVPQTFGQNFGSVNSFNNPFGAGSGVGSVFNTSGINGQLGGFGSLNQAGEAMAVA